MKNDRVGDWLWEEWDGDGYDPESELAYCTFDNIDVSNPLVLRALASCLQRDGVADSLSDGFRMAENGKVIHGYVGLLDGETTFCVCNKDGETSFGDLVESISEITWVELSL